VKVSDYVATFLADKGVRFVFELTGGMITHLLDSIAREGRVRIVSCHHEQSAAFAAEAVARLSGIPGIALATSGPGATNLMTGIGSCFFDSVPAVFVTGQVNTAELRPRPDMRQRGFQEADIVGVATPLTKAAWQVTDAGAVPDMLERAFDLACAGRPGPVLLDIPMDVQCADCSASVARAGSPTSAENEYPPRLSACAVAQVLEALTSAERPLILAGGGIRAAGCADSLRAFSAALGVPVVTSLMGLEALPYTQRERVGMLGAYGNRWANLAVGLSDMMLVLGSRLDVRQTGADTAAFAADRRIVRVDVDPAELERRDLDAMTLHADLSEFLAMAHAAAGALPAVPDLSRWRATITALRNEWPDTEEYALGTGINPARFVHRLSRASGEAGAFVTDVGQNQMWAAQSVELGAEQRFLTPGGMGAMGFALPAAIGASLAEGRRPVVGIVGDGGAQVNSQELETVVRLELPVKLVVLNNNCLGMVRQFQDEYFESRHQSTVTGYGAPDFVALAAAYDIPAMRIRAESEIDGALGWLWSEDAQPALLEVELSQASCVSPKVAFGNATHTMSARASKADLPRLEAGRATRRRKSDRSRVVERSR
jgi:acetolactate synthase-1/2/3 large subunit